MHAPLRVVTRSICSSCFMLPAWCFVAQVGVQCWSLASDLNTVANYDSELLQY